MSYDLAIWQRSESTKTAMLAEAYAAICEGGDHPAMAPFDRPAVEKSLRVEFRHSKFDPRAGIVIESGRGKSADWIIVQFGHSMAEDIVPVVVTVALSRGLLVYDPQRECVRGNKRPKKSQAKDSGRSSRKSSAP